MGSELDYAWAAGFIEADGCIHVEMRKNFRAHVIVVQKDPRPINRLQRIFDDDSKIGIVNRRKGSAKYYRWSVTGQKAINVLSKILPYLDHKLAVAEAALELQQLVTAYGDVRTKQRGAPYRVPVDQLARRRELANMVRTIRQAERLSEPAPNTVVFVGGGSWSSPTSGGAGDATVRPRLN
jgi:hypothetical protein